MEGGTRAQHQHTVWVMAFLSADSEQLRTRPPHADSCLKGSRTA